MVTKHIKVTGIPASTSVQAPDSTIPLRLEISNLYKSTDPHHKRQWTLFVLALDAFKSLAVEKPASYFQIAGIHGYPMTAWNGVEAPEQDPENLDTLHPGKDQFGGYCNHNSITFPTWHRVYLLLFEQCIWQHMKDILSSWDLYGDEYVAWHHAADRWRLPFWDWGKSSMLPEAVTADIVRIYPPISEAWRYTHRFPNPLRGFENPEKDVQGKPLPFGAMPTGKEKWNIEDNLNNKPALPWSKCSGTSRYGLDKTPNSPGYSGIEGKNNVVAANKHMNDCTQHWYSPYKETPRENEWRPPSSLSDAIRRMFDTDSGSTWGTFASTKWWQESEKEGPGYMSLEYIHNNVHNLCGGNKFSNDGGHGIGHMSDVPVAAFDPLFWLHHCNIDRLTAMWQCLNWDLWWDKPEPEHPNLPGGNLPDPSSGDPLLPFRKSTDPAVFWTSDDVRDWTKLGYQYEDLVPSDATILPNGQLNEREYKQDLERYLSVTYMGTDDYFPILQAAGTVIPRALNQNVDNGERDWDDYVLDVIYDRYALEGSSYSIEFYLDQRRVGETYSLGGMPMGNSSFGRSTGCRNCQSQQGDKVLSRAQVPLTGPLISHLVYRYEPQLASLQQDDVTAFLGQYLGWKFVRLGGEEAPVHLFPMTEVRLWMGRQATHVFADGTLGVEVDKKLLRKDYRLLGVLSMTRKEYHLLLPSQDLGRRISRPRDRHDLEIRARL